MTGQRGGCSRTIGELAFSRELQGWGGGSGYSELRVGVLWSKGTELKSGTRAIAQLTRRFTSFLQISQ